MTLRFYAGICLTLQFQFNPNVLSIKLKSMENDYSIR